MKKNSRRDFLVKGATAAVGTVLAGGLLSMCTKKDDLEATGEKVKLLDTNGNLVEVDKGHMLCCSAPGSKEVRKGMPGRHFVMVIDLSRCRNARRCVDACNSMHYLPPHHEWLKVFLMQDSEDTSSYWFPKPCFHCDTPACVNVCPVGATFKRKMVSFLSIMKDASVVSSVWLPAHIRREFSTGMSPNRRMQFILLSRVCHKELVLWGNVIFVPIFSNAENYLIA